MSAQGGDRRGFDAAMRMPQDFGEVLTSGQMGIYAPPIPLTNEHLKDYLRLVWDYWTEKKREARWWQVHRRWKAQGHLEMLAGFASSFLGSWYPAYEAQNTDSTQDK